MAHLPTTWRPSTRVTLILQPGRMDGRFAGALGRLRCRSPPLQAQGPPPRTDS